VIEVAIQTDCGRRRYNLTMIRTLEASTMAAQFWLAYPFRPPFSFGRNLNLPGFFRNIVHRLTHSLHPIYSTEKTNTKQIRESRRPEREKKARPSATLPVSTSTIRSERKRSSTGEAAARGSGVSWTTDQCLKRQSISLKDIPTCSVGVER